MKQFYALLFPLLLWGPSLFAQISDTVQLQPVTVSQIYDKPTIDRLDSVEGTYIFAGKKSELIKVSDMDMNVVNKTARQVFAKVPGIFVYDMDGTGNQINISSRGLDPHRGWEFNIRHDGILTNSDMYGYPSSHYSMPMESVDHIELVRGTGALAYGAQFGGMINYITKTPDTTKKIGFETINTAGSYGLLSSYNAVGGKVGKVTYYAYYQGRVTNGYRDYAHSQSNAQLVSINYQATKNVDFKITWARSFYRYRMPGAMTDSMFYEDPTQATRKRNYYSPAINVPSIEMNWQIAPHTHLYVVSSAILGVRNSVMFSKPTNVWDTINATTLEYSPRTVNIDKYHSYTTEIRFLQQYHMYGGLYSTLTAGVQYLHNYLHRRQLGEGTTDIDYDLTITDAGFGRNIHYHTQNVALFVENNFKLHRTFSINLGARMEMGETKLTGKAVYLPGDKIPPANVQHKFPLLGASMEYDPNKHHSLYAGFSQAYRPVVLQDMLPGSTYERTANDLKDSYGYNLEAGYRGNWKVLSWDVTGFLVRKNNRLGNFAVDSAGTLLIFKSNIGNSVAKGIELFVEAAFPIRNKVYLTIFTSTMYMDARYQDAAVRNGLVNVDVSGNKVESAPNWISRNGLTLKFWKMSFTAQYSYISETFADALNQREPDATAAVGLVPSYGLLDLHLSGQVTHKIILKVSVNNVTDKQYFTKRPQFYPGPGVWPSDGRNFSVSLGIKI